MFDRIEPGTLGRQAAGKDVDPAAGPLHGAVVFPDPAFDRLADMPGGVIPHQSQNRLSA